MRNIIIALALLLPAASACAEVGGPVRDAGCDEEHVRLTWTPIVWPSHEWLTQQRIGLVMGRCDMLSVNPAKGLVQADLSSTESSLEILCGNEVLGLAEFESRRGWGDPPEAVAARAKQLRDRVWEHCSEIAKNSELELLRNWRERVLRSGN